MRAKRGDPAGLKARTRKLTTLAAALWLGGAMGAGAARAQTPEPSPETAGRATPEEASQAPAVESPRLGRYRFGPFFFTPSFKIGTIGLDTNALYTPTGQRADVTASGGPALEVVLPVHRTFRLRGNGALTYLYFARTPSQRRLMGSALGRLEWEGSRTGLSLETSFSRQRARPSLEIDRRVLYTDTAQRLGLRRTLLGRLRLLLQGERQSREVDAGEVHLGVDLQRVLTREDWKLGADLDYALTIKTSLAATYERVFYRFTYLSGRDVDADRLMGGFRTDASALISGHALAGVIWVRPRGGGRTLRNSAVYDVDAMLNLSVKTHIGGSYRRDLTFSALAVSAAVPTLLSETYGARLEKDLVGNLNLELFARRTRLWDDGDVELVLPDGGSHSGTRRDRADELGGDLGYRFRARFRVGVAASYLRRRSTVSYLGIEGLLVGLSVRYTP